MSESVHDDDSHGDDFSDGCYAKEDDPGTVDSSSFDDEEGIRQSFESDSYGSLSGPGSHSAEYSDQEGSSSQGSYYSDQQDSPEDSMEFEVQLPKGVKLTDLNEEELQELMEQARGVMKNQPPEGSDSSEGSVESGGMDQASECGNEEENAHDESGDDDDYETPADDASYSVEGSSHQSGEGSYGSQRDNASYSDSGQSREGSYDSQEDDASQRDNASYSDSGQSREGYYDSQEDDASYSVDGSHQTDEECSRQEDVSYSVDGSQQSGEGSDESQREDVSYSVDGSHQSGEGSNESTREASHSECQDGSHQNKSDSENPVDEVASIDDDSKKDLLSHSGEESYGSLQNSKHSNGGQQNGRPSEDGAEDADSFVEEYGGQQDASHSEYVEESYHSQQGEEKCENSPENDEPYDKVERFSQHSKNVEDNEESYLEGNRETEGVGSYHSENGDEDESSRDEREHGGSQHRENAEEVETSQEDSTQLEQSYSEHLNGSLSSEDHDESEKEDASLQEEECDSDTNLNLEPGQSVASGSEQHREIDRRDTVDSTELYRSMTHLYQSCAHLVGEEPKRKRRGGRRPGPDSGSNVARTAYSGGDQNSQIEPFPSEFVDDDHGSYENDVAVEFGTFYDGGSGTIIQEEDRSIAEQLESEQMFPELVGLERGGVSQAAINATEGSHHESKNFDQREESTSSQHFDGSGSDGSGSYQSGGHSEKSSNGIVAQSIPEDSSGDQCESNYERTIKPARYTESTQSLIEIESLASFEDSYPAKHVPQRNFRIAPNMESSPVEEAQFNSAEAEVSAQGLPQELAVDQRESHDYNMAKPPRNTESTQSLIEIESVVSFGDNYPPEAVVETSNSTTSNEDSSTVEEPEAEDVDNEALQEERAIRMQNELKVNSATEDSLLFSELFPGQISDRDLSAYSTSGSTGPSRYTASIPSNEQAEPKSQHHDSQCSDDVENDREGSNAEKHLPAPPISHRVSDPSPRTNTKVPVEECRSRSLLLLKEDQKISISSEGAASGIQLKDTCVYEKANARGRCGEGAHKAKATRSQFPLGNDRTERLTVGRMASDPPCEVISETANQLRYVDPPTTVVSDEEVSGSDESLGCVDPPKDDESNTRGKMEVLRYRENRCDDSEDSIAQVLQILEEHYDKAKHCNKRKEATGTKLGYNSFADGQIANRSDPPGNYGGEAGTLVPYANKSYVYHGGGRLEMGYIDAPVRNVCHQTNERDDMLSLEEDKSSEKTANTSPTFHDFVDGKTEFLGKAEQVDIESHDKGVGVDERSKASKERTVTCSRKEAKTQQYMEKSKTVTSYEKSLELTDLFPEEFFDVPAEDRSSSSNSADEDGSSTTTSGHAEYSDTTRVQDNAECYGTPKTPKMSNRSSHKGVAERNGLFSDSRAPVEAENSYSDISDSQPQLNSNFHSYSSPDSPSSTSATDYADRITASMEFTCGYSTSENNSTYDDVELGQSGQSNDTDSAWIPMGDEDDVSPQHTEPRTSLSDDGWGDAVELRKEKPWLPCSGWALFHCICCFLIGLTIVLSVALIDRGDEDDSNLTTSPTESSSVLPTSPPMALSSAAPAPSPNAIIPWVLMDSLDATDGSAFGTAVAIQGDILVAGEPQSGLGKLRSYHLIATGDWIEEEVLTGDHGYSQYGASVDLKTHRLIVGAPLTFAEGTITPVGAAYFYIYNRALGKWLNVGGTIRGEPDITVAANEQFGSAVAVSGFRVVVGAPRNSLKGTEAGRVYTFEQRQREWVSTEVFPIAGLEEGEKFGSALSISEDGKRFVAGAPGSRAFSTAPRSGSARLYNWSGTSWEFELELHGRDDLEAFGSSVVMLSDTGNVFAVGGPGFRNGAGRIVVFQQTLNDDGYEQLGEAITGETGDELGSSGSLSGSTSDNGLSVVAGTSSGLVKRFDYDQETNSWKERYMQISSESFQGISLDFFQNGGKDMLVIGSAKNDLVSVYEVAPVNPDTQAPSVPPTAKPVKPPTPAPTVVTSKSTHLPTGTPVTRAPTPAPSVLVTQPWIQSGGSFDFGLLVAEDVGTAVALAEDNMASGSPATLNMGSVWIFGKSNNAWNSESTQLLVGEQDEGLFGAALDMTDHEMIVGAPGIFAESTTTPSGAAYFYERISVSGNWEQVGAALRGAAGLFSANEEFGASVAMSKNRRVVIGAPGSSVDNQYRRGRVYLYEYDTDTAEWQLLYDVAGESVSEGLGSAVDISEAGDLFIAGSPFGAMDNTGFATVYQYTFYGWIPKLTILGHEGGEQMGTSVHFLTEDGSLVAAGAPGYQGERGRVLVYEQDPVTGFYEQVGPDIVGEPGERLGRTNLLSGKGSDPVVIVGTAMGLVKEFKLDRVTDTWMVTSQTMGADLLALSANTDSFVVGGDEDTRVYELN